MKKRSSNIEAPITPSNGGCCTSTSTEKTQSNIACCDQPIDNTPCCDKNESKEVNVQKTGCC